MTRLCGTQWPNWRLAKPERCAAGWSWCDENNCFEKSLRKLWSEKKLWEKEIWGDFVKKIMENEKKEEWINGSRLITSFNLMIISLLILCLNLIEFSRSWWISVFELKSNQLHMKYARCICCCLITMNMAHICVMAKLWLFT